MIKELVPRSRYGPPGLAERVYDDLYGPYGPNAIRSQPPQFLRTRSAEGFAKGHMGYGSVRTLAVAGRIQTPPHDMTAAQPHPSGHSLSFTGTWRASGKEHQDSGMSSARECVHRLLTGTTPATASRPATVLPVRRSMLSLADGNPSLHTETIAAPAVLRAPNIWPHYYREHFNAAKDARHRTRKHDGSGIAAFFYDVPTTPAGDVHPDHGAVAPYSADSSTWLPGERRFREQARATPAMRQRSTLVPLEDRTLIGGWRFGYNPGHMTNIRSKYR